MPKIPLVYLDTNNINVDRVEFAFSKLYPEIYDEKINPGLSMLQRAQKTALAIIKDAIENAEREERRRQAKAFSEDLGDVLTED